MPYLLFTLPEDRQKKRIRLDRPRLTIGRAPDNDLVLTDQKVSRHHCAIEQSDGRVTLRDLGSTGGTLVNGERRVKHVLADGDTIRVGPYHIQYQAAMEEGEHSAPWGSRAASLKAPATPDDTADDTSEYSNSPAAVTVGGPGCAADPPATTGEPEDELVRRREQLLAAEAELDQVRRELEEREEAVRALEAQVTAATRSVQDLEKELAEAQSARDRAEVEAVDHLRAQEKIEGTLNSLRDEHAAAEARVQDLAAALARAEQQQRDATEALNREHGDRRDLEERLSALEDDRAEAGRREKSLRARLRRAERSREQAAEFAAEADRERSVLVAAAARRKHEHRRVSTEMAKLRRRLKSLEKNRARLARRVEAAEALAKERRSTSHPPATDPRRSEVSRPDAGAPPDPAAGTSPGDAPITPAPATEEKSELDTTSDVVSKAPLAVRPAADDHSSPHAPPGAGLLHEDRMMDRDYLTWLLAIALVLIGVGAVVGVWLLAT
ncbi:MAG: FHA domain-containing protein [Planctomycetota bacterium]|jgi:pSer/pThr/pTyr-binding forkhead associated (FHA) protein